MCRVEPIAWRWIGLGIFIVVVSCSDEPEAPPNEESLGARLKDVTVEYGLAQPAQALSDGSYQLSEITGPGVGLLDYDRDGRLDILEIRSAPPSRIDEPTPNRLYRQREDGKFEEVGAEAKIDDPGHGQGVVIGDVNNDGFDDVYVTNFGRDSFYLNRGDGSFENRTEAAGLGLDRWTCSGAFLDYDRDGDLDLFLAHYVRFDSQVECRDDNSRLEYCGPKAYDREPDTLYQNQGDGTFVDVSQEAGIVLPGAGLGVLCADMNNDGWVDIFVANDGHENHLWINQGDGTFVEEAFVLGVAVNGFGQSEASMGVSLGDVDLDGHYDLFLTHLQGETNTLYTRGASSVFVDRSTRSGISHFDRPYTGFGCAMMDLENDGDLDLAIANGRVTRGQVLDGANRGEFWNRYAEPNLFLLNDGLGSFEKAVDGVHAFVSPVEISRGLAIGDLDRDGDLDLVLNQMGGLRVFLNDTSGGGHWLRVRAISEGRNALGADISVRAGGKTWRTPIMAASSYASSSEPMAHFGLGAAKTIDQIEVSWPDGTRERFSGPPVNQSLVLIQGDGDSVR